MEQEFLSGFAVIALVAFLGAISPGPDFVIVAKNSLTYSRKTGILTAFGVSLGVLVHICYCLMGIGFFIAESALLFNCIKYAGAAYLIYIGFKSVLTKQTRVELSSGPQENDLTRGQAIRVGFLTNAFNPKATLFFLSVFSQVIDPGTPLITQIVYALEMWLITLAWFICLAFSLSHPYLRSKIVNMQEYVEKTMGLLLIAFGLKIAFI